MRYHSICGWYFKILTNHQTTQFSEQGLKMLILQNLFLSLLYKLYPKQIGLFPLIDKIITLGGGGGELLGHTVCKLGYIKNSLPFQ